MDNYTKYKLSIHFLTFFLLFFVGCAPAFNCGLKKKTERKILETEVIPVFSTDVNSYLFKTKIHVYGQYFSGLLALKQMDNHNFRAVFLSEVGMKFFDFEFFPTSTDSTDFKVHYCMEVFKEKEKLLNTIENDLRMLMVGYLPDSAISYEHKHDSIDAFRFDSGKERSFYYVKRGTGQLQKIRKSGLLFRKVDIDLYDYKNDFPETILIRHRNIKLNIEFNFLHN